MNRCHPSITEKRLRNKRFWRTEEAILKAFFDENNYTSIGKMTEKAGVARTTFYRHHRTVNRIVTDYKVYILNKYNRVIKKLLLRRGASVKFLYERMLLFIIQNKKYFRILMLGKETDIFPQMIKKMEPRLVSIMGLPKNSEKIFLVYTGEITALLDAWCKDEKNIDEIEKILSEMVYLTETARIRLKVLL